MKTKKIILTAILSLIYISGILAENRFYTLDKLNINNVNPEQEYIVSINYITDSGKALPKVGEFSYEGFSDNSGYVKNVTAIGPHLHIRFYHRDTSAQINGSIIIHLYAIPESGSSDMLSYTLILPYSYSALTSVDPGEIAGPTDFHMEGERPSQIKSIRDAIPLSGSTIAYSWEKKSFDGTWCVIDDAFSNTFHPDTIGTVSDYYRRKATDSAGNSAYSNTVEVLPMPNGGEIGIEYTDAATTLSLTDIKSPNSTDVQISWQSSVDLDTWTAISGNTKSITTGKPSITTYYRRKATTLANDSYGDPIAAYSNIVCFSLATPECISTMSYWSADSTVTDIDYYDGLGRKLQSVAAKATMDGKDVVTAYRYDNRGREAGVSVPFCKSGNGEFAHNAMYKNSVYHNDSHAYTTLLYESSPLDRITATYKPGDEYRNTSSPHCATTSYNVNGDNEVRLLKLSGGGFRVKGYHPVATLYKTVTADEDGAVLEIFTSARGNTILERRRAGDGIFADTYYVYDSKERVRCVVSPKGSAMLAPDAEYSDTCSLVRDLCFTYSYDSDDRIVMKRLPGRSAEYFGYDTQGRLSTYYDERMQQEGVTKCYAYDAIGRVVGFRYDGADGACCQQRNHYDDYSYSGVASFSPVEGVVERGDLAASVKGLLTYDRTFELYSNWASEARQQTYWYDSRGRCVQTHTAYPVGINCRTSVKYDYAGNPLATVEQFSGSGGVITILTECTFDSHGRKLTEKTSVNGNTVAHAAFAYDELGRVTETSLNGNIEITADYNLQGWLTGLQASKKSDGFIVSDVIFNETLRYHDTDDSLAVPLYAGKIAQLDWQRTMQMSGNDRFLYSYDPQGRLIKAEHRITGTVNSTAGNYSEETEYDLNSNITSFNAVKENENIQQVHTLNGNRIVGAEYDSRGNITRIPSKNLQIEYNLCNLPQSISNSDGTKINYSYLSDGTKFRAVSETGVNYLYTGSMRWRLQGGTITPESFAVAGGRATFDGSDWMVHYYITDHLGSTRAVTDTLGNVLAKFDYTPYGELLASNDNTTAGTDYLFTGKERQAKQGASELYDSQARFMDTGGRFLSIDPLAEEYYHLSPYTYCAGDPVKLVDPDGEAWKPTYTYVDEKRRDFNGFEWIDEEDSYDDNGVLKEGLYSQAIFFSDNGTFDINNWYNIGSSTAYVYLEDGNIVTFDACTNPSAEDYPIIPEKLVEATYGKHKGTYYALRMHDFGDNHSRIKLGYQNPQFPNNDYIEGANIHKAGKYNKTGMTKKGQAISAGCFLIDRNRWDEFIGHFNRKSKVAVVASRNGVKSPLNRNVNYKPDLKIVRFTKP